MSSEAQMRSALLGTWTHTNPDGSYRTKVMTPYSEQLSFYKPDGTLIQRRDPIPFRVQINGTEKLFTAFFQNGGTWTASFDIKDGLWYEQKEVFWKTVNSPIQRRMNIGSTTEGSNLKVSFQAS
jgi:hypothetical protein